MCILAILSMASELSVGSFELASKFTNSSFDSIAWCCKLAISFLIRSRQSMGIHRVKLVGPKSSENMDIYFQTIGFDYFLANMQDSYGNWELPSQSGLLKD